VIFNFLDRKVHSDSYILKYHIGDALLVKEVCSYKILTVGFPNTAAQQSLYLDFPKCVKARGYCFA